MSLYKFITGNSARLTFTQKTMNKVENLKTSMFLVWIPGFPNLNKDYSGSEEYTGTKGPLDITQSGRFQSSPFCLVPWPHLNYGISGSLLQLPNYS